ncbi:PRD domain-containing protein (plasmid) [Pseudomonas silvicola]|nr:PRD domain-containing protein [Pseudomonas silvicola]
MNMLADLSRLLAELGLNLILDAKLRRDLAQHIKPMLNRLAYIAIHNPLLEDIKLEFGRAFETVRCATEKLSVNFDYPATSDDEVAYLTLYIQTALEKFSACKKIIIVCSSGVGTSQLLASRINRAFPEWEIVDIVLEPVKCHVRHKNCDLIVSTIKLEGVELPIAYVSALFSKKDIARVSEKIIFTKIIKESDDAR